MHLASLLERVSVPDSTGFVSIDTAKTLFETLATLPTDDASSLNTMVLGITNQTLPSLKFKDASVAQATAFFIRQMVPFINELDKLLISVGEISLDGIEVPPQFAGYTTKVQEFATSFKDNLAEQINELKTLTTDLITTEKTEGMADILKKMQSIIHLVEHPLDGFSLGKRPKDKLATAVAKKAMETFIKLAKGQVIGTLSKHIEDTVHLQIADSVLRLSINDDVLSLESEKNTKLSVCLKDFLIAQIPPLKGDKLALEMNNIFIQQKILEQFTKRLKQLGDPPRRDALLALLYHRDYFKNPNELISIKQLTKCISCFIGHPHLNLETAFTTVLRCGCNPKHYST